MQHQAEAHAMAASEPRGVRSFAIGLIGFLTLVDLFATQAILPSLAVHYGVSASQIGLAANASTVGMAISGLLTGMVAGGLPRRTGVWVSLLLLAIPTTLLAFAPDLGTFALLRGVQGLFMASAFTLTLAHFGERCSRSDIATALAAYVTGGVASNLVGRLIAAGVAGSIGTAASFFVFATLNVVGAALAYAVLTYTQPMAVGGQDRGSYVAAWRLHLANPLLRRAYACGFLILFGFVGIFSYVGFVLTKPPLSLSMMAIGYVFFCFAPSMVTTPMAGRITARHGADRTLPLSLLLALGGLGLLLADTLTAVVAGLVLVAVGTFFAQAVATGYVGRAATAERPAASGLYLAAYYLGGLAGAASTGLVFDASGWPSAVAVNFAALAACMLIGRGLRETPPSS